MLSVNDLCFRYGSGREILKDITFTLRRGEVLCLLGPNGTGKTTLLKCLLGLLRPQNGQIRLQNEDLLHSSTKRRAQIISYVPQSSMLNFPYTVLETVMMGRLPHLGFGSAPTPRDYRAAESTLKEMGIADLADRFFQKLSGGERQLVMIARALAQEAHLLILDEPTANLDFFNQTRTLKLIRCLARQERTILLTTHSPDHAFLVADQIIMIKNGNIFSRGSPDEVITNDHLSDLYGVRAVVSDTSVISLGKSIKVCVPILDIDE
ncbi:MAG: ABC transporter ATP-binding protein [Burkholderiales bacterium]|jgi:iron complex transport system ATP-binding protein|nr:ABC transporter ATP-binding protein [Burkholderiales bacterium]